MNRYVLTAVALMLVSQAARAEWVEESWGEDGTSDEYGYGEAGVLRIPKPDYYSIGRIGRVHWERLPEMEVDPYKAVRIWEDSRSFHAGTEILTRPVSLVPAKWLPELSVAGDLERRDFFLRNGHERRERFSFNEEEALKAIIQAARENSKSPDRPVRSGNSKRNRPGGR